MGVTFRKEPQVGFDPWASAARTEPLYMGHTPTELNYTPGYKIFLIQMFYRVFEAASRVKTNVIYCM